MKKRILAAVMALVLAVTMYSGIRLSSVNANADENDKDITLSVTTDKTDVRPGDEVTVTVNIEKFTPTTNNSDNPFISMWQVFVPVDTSVFEFVGFDEDSTTLIDDGFNFDSAVDMAKAVMSYNINKKNRPNIYYLDTDKNGENSTSVVYKFKLRVKSDISDNKSVSFDLSDSSIFKQFNTPAKFTYTTMPTTVTYQGKTATFKVYVVDKTAQSLELNGVTGKSVTEGMKLDVTGMTAVIRYDDGSSKTVDITEDMLTYSTDKTGQAIVRVSVEGLTKEFTINVVAKKAVSVKLSGTDNKSVVEGMKLDLAGINAEVTYDNGTKETVKVTDDMVTYNTDKIGSSEAAVKIGDITEKFAFTVVAKTLTEIKVVNDPSKGTYLEGQKFDLTGLSVQAVYNNGTTEDITEAIKLSDVDTAKAGTKTVTVTYKGKTATFTVEVKTRDAVDAFNKSVTDLLNKDITKEDIETVKKLRADYEAMSDAEKEECDIKGLTKLEESVNKILEEENKATEDSKDETGNTTTPSSDSESTSGVKTGDAVNMYVYIMIALLAVLTAACTVPYVRKNRK